MQLEWTHEAIPEYGSSSALLVLLAAAALSHSDIANTMTRLSKDREREREGVT